MKARELTCLLKQNNAPRVLDVRSRFEYRGGHIPGALHVPILQLMLGLSRLPADKSAPYVVVCEHGPRAQMVSGILARRGFTRLELLEGHMHAWRSQGLPLEK